MRGAASFKPAQCPRPTHTINVQVHYQNTDVDTGALHLSTGYRLFIRPQADRLVSALLQEPRCCFAVISCMGHWHCLPAMRALLQQAVRGDWEVEGGIEGRLTSYSQEYTCCIEGTTLYCDEHRTSEVVDVLDARTFKVEEAGKTYYGELTK